MLLSGFQLSQCSVRISRTKQLDEDGQMPLAFRALQLATLEVQNAVEPSRASCQASQTPEITRVCASRARLGRELIESTASATGSHLVMLRVSRYSYELLAHRVYPVGSSFESWIAGSRVSGEEGVAFESPPGSRTR